MASETKFIHTVGIEQREIRLIQSFLNLLPIGSYHFEIDIKARNRPSVIIVDEVNHHDEIGKEYAKVLVIVIGADIGSPDPTYLHRPIQWSKFKAAIDLLKVNPELTVEAGLTQVIEVDGKAEDLDKSQSYRIDSEQSAYKTGDDIGANSSHKVYDIEEPTIGALLDHSADHGVTLSQADVDLAQQYDSLDRLGANINFWEGERCQVLVGGAPVLFVLPEKGMVYSEYGFHDWEALLRSKDTRKALITKDWGPFGKMKSYPINWLAWSSAHARSKGYLLSDLNRNSYFLLNKWPEFDLLYNNNEHMKLCGLMFKEGQSIQELVSKTHIRARIIIGLINACHRHGVLSAFPDKDSSRPKVNDNSIDAHTVMSLLSKVFK